MSVTDDEESLYFRDDENNVHFRTRDLRSARKLEAKPTVGPEDIRRMAGDAMRMQDALIAIRTILKRPAPSHQSLAMHHAYMLRDIHKAVNLPEPEGVKRILGE